MDFIKKVYDVITGRIGERACLPLSDAGFRIQTGAQLTVRESQMAVFVNEGNLADAFAPGRHKLTTQTLPLLTNLNNWDKLFDSPFKSNVYFFSPRLRLDRKWGTPNPITIRDKDFGMVRLRAFCISSCRLTAPKVFREDVSGTRHLWRTRWPVAQHHDRRDHRRSPATCGSSTWPATSSGSPRRCACTSSRCFPSRPDARLAGGGEHLAAGRNQKTLDTASA